MDEFRQALDGFIDAPSDPVLDLSDVDFLPSMAIGALVGACRRDWGSVTVVARRDCFAAKVLKLCGIPFEDATNLPQPIVS